MQNSTWTYNSFQMCYSPKSFANVGVKVSQIVYHHTCCLTAACRAFLQYDQLSKLSKNNVGWNENNTGCLAGCF